MNSYTGLERVIAVLNLEKPDRVPTFEWSIHSSVLRSISGQNDIYRFTDEMDIDGIVIYEDVIKKQIDAQSYIDEWGVTQVLAGADYPTATDHPLTLPEDIEDFIPPDPHAPHRFDDLKKAVKHYKGKRAILFRLRDAYSIPRNLRGMQNIMMDYVLHPDLVHRLIDISVDYYTELAYHAMELGADLFWSSDDYCDNRGPTMGPEIWRQFILPGLSKLVTTIKNEGYHFIKHNDGNITEILPELINSGISCIDPIDTGAGMDLEKVKSGYGDRIAIKGGIPLNVLVDGSPGDVAETVEKCIETAGFNGGYICSSASDITGAVKPENYQAMIQTVQKIRL